MLEEKFQEQDGILCDFKLEFGLNEKGRIILGDSIEPDGWRLWDKSPDNNLDRNDGYEKVFSVDVTSLITEKYILTSKFITKVFS
jgi:phosphoribosylaminoimidazole-succinocarboxamide synthase